MRQSHWVSCKFGVILQKCTFFVRKVNIELPFLLSVRPAQLTRCNRIKFFTIGTMHSLKKFVQVCTRCYTVVVLSFPLLKL